MDRCDDGKDFEERERKRERYIQLLNGDGRAKAVYNFIVEERGERYYIEITPDNPGAKTDIAAEDIYRYELYIKYILYERVI